MRAFMRRDWMLTPFGTAFYIGATTIMTAGLVMAAMG
jgi:hypothetical protein